jgi:PAS domain S-box-containing protein
VFADVENQAELSMPIRDLLSSGTLFSDPIALVSTDGTIDTPNQAFAEQVGVPAEALKGKRLDALAAASAAAIQEFLGACARSAEVVQGSILLRRRAETVAIQTRAIAYPPSAAPSASQVLLRLVTQRELVRSSEAETTVAEQRQPQHWREIEESLRRQSQILEVTLASIGDAVLVADTQGHITFLNSVAETLTGWTTQEAKGRPLGQVFPVINERTRHPIDDPVARVLQTGTIVGLGNHTVLIARDGRELPIDDSAAPIRMPNGELFGVVLVFRDISELRRAGHARAWLAAIIESSDDAIVSKTLDGNVTSWNPGAVRLFGYEPEEIIGRPITTIIPSELQNEEIEVLTRLRRGERVDNFETVRVAKDGRRIDVSLTVSPVRDEGGIIVGASKIARDITERKRAERELREADKRKDDFLAVLAHELRNPLAPMHNAAEIMRRAKNERPELQRACDIMDRQLQHMTRLVEDLLDVARIGAGQVQLAPEVVELGSVIRSIEASLSSIFQTSGQQLTVSVCAEPVAVYADRTRLVQVFANLLQNANKYTPRGGRIDVDVRREADCAKVTVSDTGYGIPAEMLRGVFELYVQVDPSNQRTRGGLGIGLALAKRLVELHGGTIEAHSPGEGQGSVFTVRLPMTAASRSSV